MLLRKGQDCSNDKANESNKYECLRDAHCNSVMEQPVEFEDAAELLNLWIQKSMKLLTHKKGAMESYTSCEGHTFSDATNNMSSNTHLQCIVEYLWCLHRCWHGSAVGLISSTFRCFRLDSLYEKPRKKTCRGPVYLAWLLVKRIGNKGWRDLWMDGWNGEKDVTKHSTTSWKQCIYFWRKKAKVSASTAPAVCGFIQTKSNMTSWLVTNSSKLYLIILSQQCCQHCCVK